MYATPVTSRVVVLVGLGVPGRGYKSSPDPVSGVGVSVSSATA